MASEYRIKVKIEPDLSGLVDLQSAAWDLGQALCKFAKVLSTYTGTAIPADDLSMDKAPEPAVQNCPAVHNRAKHAPHDWTRAFVGQPDRWFHCPGLDIEVVDKSNQCGRNTIHGPHEWTPPPPRVGVPIRCPGRSDG